MILSLECKCGNEVEIDLLKEKIEIIENNFTIVGDSGYIEIQCIKCGYEFIEEEER